ncbi:Acetyltransferase [Croceitalea dokdonensis DOKDO 023]|uniref:Acetyltransferase n=1 Tax=Croceitalea dokdonensis DOKDO 023 TaxID=1300341 RepID=A0A0P7AVG6_9FLAO|nr:acyltransferase [Croceitalea dokdonensis]KPM30357.1 Acetyltransferase [Croceitalea dokdonensis DOKDO 023]
MLLKIWRTRLVWLYYLRNYAYIKIKKVQYESYPTISGKLFLFGTGSLQIGRGVRMNSGTRANPIGGDNKLIINVLPGATVQIGNMVGMSNCTLVCHESVRIDDNVKIGGGVKIYDTDFHSLLAEHRKNPETDKPLTGPITIGKNAFIGGHSIILKGVSIGANSIIGAGSLVTKDIPPNEIWGGNPARLIKKTS